MSMALALQTISDENIDRVLADPPLILGVIAPETTPPGLSTANGEGLETDLDTAWHGIHYLLTGTAWEGPDPLNFIICGGTSVGDIDVGNGPARVIRSEDVVRLVAALSEIDGSVLRERFNSEEMMNLEIYPEIWDRDPDEDDTLDDCIEFYEDLRKFLAKAANDSLGIALYTC